MTDVEFFQMKNPEATYVYCGMAAELYRILLNQDAFEEEIQIENYHDSFIFRFPKGHIIIGDITTRSSTKSIPCFLAYSGITPGIVCYTFNQIASWLRNEWNNLLEGKVLKYVKIRYLYETQSRFITRNLL